MGGERARAALWAAAEGLCLECGGGLPGSDFGVYRKRTPDARARAHTHTHTHTHVHADSRAHTQNPRTHTHTTRALARARAQVRREVLAALAETREELLGEMRALEARLAGLDPVPAAQHPPGDSE